MTKNPLRLVLPDGEDCEHYLIDEGDITAMCCSKILLGYKRIWYFSTKAKLFSSSLNPIVIT